MASERAPLRATLLVLGCAAASALAACAGRSSNRQVSVAQYEALRRAIGADQAAAAPDATGAPPSATGSGSANEAGQAAPPPRSDAERRARASRALAPGRSLGELVTVGDGRYAFALEPAPAGSAIAGSSLLLFDLSSDPALLVGEHEFGVGEIAGGRASSAGGEAPEGSGRPDAEPAGPPRILQTLDTKSDSSDPLVLAEIAQPDGSLACGWWLRRRGTTFVCAPGIGGRSSYQVVDGGLVETWQAALPGTAGFDDVSGASGRLLRLNNGRWREEDQFRCLGLPLDKALKDAGRQGLSAWQTAAVQQRTSGAMRASESLDTDTAIGMLHDALTIDACNPVTWRLLGRLEFDAGDTARAVPALAVALALAPRDASAMVDLADALAVLNPGPSAGSESLRQALRALDSRDPTRDIVSHATPAGAAAPAPRQLARVLYARFLELTRDEDVRLAAARRHAAEQEAALARAPTAGRPPAKRAHPAAAHTRAAASGKKTTATRSD